MSTKVFIVLISLTVMTFLVGYFNFINTYILVLILGSVLLKGQLIIDYFMGLHEVHLKYRIIPSIWLVLVVVLIFMAYYFPVSV